MPDQSHMVESSEIKETMIPEFIEKQLSGKEPARCVDGREAEESEQGPQMPGGDTLPALLAAIFHDKDLDQQNISQSISSLNEYGIKTGAHRGAHAHEDQSDCGFVDKLPSIVQRAHDQREEITTRLKNVYSANTEKFPDLNPQLIEGLLSSAFDKISSWDASRIKISGNSLVNLLEKANSTVETVVGDHQEQVVFVNIKPDTTLDTKKLNAQGKQGFNLDVPAAVDHAKKLGVPEDFSLPASLILYQATEMVLVEDKGKQALPIEIHA